MARIPKGITGPLVGRIGSVIGSSRRGVPHLKGLYKKRTRRISSRERANREKFGLTQAWLQPIIEVVREGFRNYSQKAEGFVVAKGLLQKNSLVEIKGHWSVNPSTVQISYGALPLSDGFTMKLEKPGTLLIEWDNSSPRKYANDQVMVLAYDIKNQVRYYILQGEFRKTGAERLPVAGKPGTVLHVYAAFVAADRESQSNSIYLGEIKL